MVPEKLQQFMEYYDQYYPRAYKYSYYRLGGEVESAHELTEQIFHLALEKFPSFTSPMSFDTWLFRCVHRELDDMARKQKPAQELSEGVILEGKELKLFKLTSAVHKLPREPRAVIELRFFAGCSTEDLADILGISVNQVYVVTNRAVSALKKLLP